MMSEIKILDSAVFRLKFARFNFLKIAGLMAIVATFLFFQTACNSDYYFQKKIEIPNENWTYGDTLNFQFSIADTLEIYSLYLDIEYVDTFPTQNIYLKLYTQFPDGKRLSKVKSFDLYDLQGEPLGQCSGRKCNLQAVLQEKAFFSSLGDYEITLEQYTREQSLPGISSIGLAIKATGVQR